MPSDSQIIQALLSAIKGQQAEIAESAMMTPRAEPFAHGMQVGVYQGLQQALETLNAILRDDYEKEKHS
jgi:hypothetical protein